MQTVTAKSSFARGASWTPRAGSAWEGYALNIVSSGRNVSASRLCSPMHRQRNIAAHGLGIPRIALVGISILSHRRTAWW